jgi:hypothetical protein
MIGDSEIKLFARVVLIIIAIMMAVGFALGKFTS